MNDYFVYFDLISLHLFRYLHFYPSDCEAQAKAKISRNAYTELTRSTDSLSLSLLSNPNHMFTLLWCRCVYCKDDKLTLHYATSPRFLQPLRSPDVPSLKSFPLLLTSLSLPANMQQSMETYTSSKGWGRETWVWRFRKKVKCFHVYLKVLCEHNILLIQIKLGHLISQGWDGWREKLAFSAWDAEGPKTERAGGRVMRRGPCL